MSESESLGSLLDHLQRVAPLERAEAARLVAEVLACLDETVEDFIRRRHDELQGRGYTNAVIFQLIDLELRSWRFRAPGLTERQIRRVVYG